ncbi:MAG: tRNA pseudouridine(38-40) synthase TruA [Coriobacteriia bacterium]
MSQMEREMPTVVLVVGYEGSGFAGFQIQPGVRTVQGCLEEALRTVLDRDLRLSCAGRTDAGVHALGQVVSFPADPSEVDLEKLRDSLNGLTGDDICIRAARWAVPGFSARHHALSRTYLYRVRADRVPPVLSAPLVWWVKRPLDTAAMAEGASHLVGEHDFTSFCVAASAQGHDVRREVLAVDVFGHDVAGEECIGLRVKGRSFLHSMVRAIAGTLVEVGRGRRRPDWVREVLAARDRAAAGMTAPARGLVLESVEYADDVWLDRA